MGKPLPGFEVRIVDGELQVQPRQLPDLLQPLPRRRAVRGRVVADGRRGRRGRRRLPLVRGATRRPDPLLGLPDRPVRGRVRPAHPPGGRRGGRRRRPGPRARGGGAGDRRPARRASRATTSSASSRSTASGWPPRTSSRASSSSPTSCRRPTSGKIKRAELRAAGDALSADAPLALRRLRRHLRRHAALADGRRGRAAGAAALRPGTARLGRTSRWASSWAATR